jgi:protein-S-isoprenylcysteine O-methyltransferase Ste14
MKKSCATFIALSAAIASAVTVRAQDGAIQLLPDQIKWTALPPDVTSGATWMILAGPLDRPVHYTLRVHLEKGGTRMTTGNHEREVGMSSQRVSGTAVQRTIAVLGSAVFFVVAPCTLAGLVPWSITGWQLRPPFLGLELTRGIGAIMILAGVPGLVDAFARFALQGLGTPAPVAPPRNLVVTGLYRYVRNPIYVAVVAIILGQAVLMGDWRLIVYGALLWLAFHVFVVAYEEPTLERTFGREYEAFRAAVPRWIPRMTPWRSK